MKRCIWCLKSEEEATFIKPAHTIPQSLGGKNICENVCDDCNAFFGSHYLKLPPVETVIKEAFNISRARFLNSFGDIGKNRSLSKFSSIYFKVDFKSKKISLKPSYRINYNFQNNLSRQLKKGIYKIYLEEIERQFGEAHNSKYNFIREFARWNIGDYPLIYFERDLGVFFIIEDLFKFPELLLGPTKAYNYLLNEVGFDEIELLGHVFGITTTRNWELVFDNYIKKSMEAKSKFFNNWRFVESFNDIDLTLSVLDQK